MLIPLGEDASVNDVIGKLDDFYGNVSSAETILQSFYSDNQKEDESGATFGSRLEQTLSKAIRYGHMELAPRDSMLRSKFWTGLRSQQLRNSTRYLYDTYKDFPSLLRKIRKVEQEDFCSTRPTPPTKQKVVQQHSGQVSFEQSEFNDKITKQMSELMGIVKSFEKKLESQQQSIAAVTEHQSSTKILTMEIMIMVTSVVKVVAIKSHGAVRGVVTVDVVIQITKVVILITYIITVVVSGVVALGVVAMVVLTAVVPTVVAGLII